MGCIRNVRAIARPESVTDGISVSYWSLRAPGLRTIADGLQVKSILPLNRPVAFIRLPCRLGLAPRANS